jgi:hypothetical protein
MNVKAHYESGPVPGIRILMTNTGTVLAILAEGNKQTSEERSESVCDPTSWGHLQNLYLEILEGPAGNLRKSSQHDCKSSASMWESICQRLDAGKPVCPDIADQRERRIGNMECIMGSESK